VAVVVVTASAVAAVTAVVAADVPAAVVAGAADLPGANRAGKKLQIVLIVRWGRRFRLPFGPKVHGGIGFRHPIPASASTP
jgi:hypothetical protein